MEVVIANEKGMREKAFQLRYQVVIGERQIQHCNARHDTKMLYDEDDNECSTLFCAVNNEQAVIATIRINWGKFGVSKKNKEIFMLDKFSSYPQAAFAFISKLIIAPNERKGYVFGLLIFACYQQLRQEGIKFCFCQARADLQPLYQRLGFRYYGQPFLDPEINIYQQTSVLICEDVDYLRKCNAIAVNYGENYIHNATASEWFSTHMVTEQEPVVSL